MDDETKALANAVLESIRRMAVHYGLWFAKAVDRFGIDDARLSASNSMQNRREGSSLFARQLCAPRDCRFAHSRLLLEYYRPG